jgi:hypothetical protein
MAKPIAALIIAKAKGSSKPTPEMDETEVIAEELISAIKAGDSKKVAMILKDFIACCEGQSQE